ncbi:MAG: ABC transporter ATP-binding protein [Chloroflexi bacterium]|nr:ABC transporter ATP-binding protein [Chloroflexota bacterium]
MFGGGLDGARRLMSGEQLKPRNLRATLRRFGYYFSRHWQGGVAALILIFLSTWAQVTSPDLIGQAVDCYLLPNNHACWYTNANVDTMSKADKIAGLGGLSMILLALFVGAALMQGTAFFAMRWSGNHAMRQMRQDLFNKIHRLSLNYYSTHEVGNIMSRLTNDTDTINQALSFALMSVISGVLLIVWIAIKMLRANVPYALVSLSVVPIMFVATVYFSNQARKAFRKSRQEMGSVNADLQQSIAGAREVQAFNRENATIEQFKRVNAANRDANVRAATFTSALNPMLEALGYVAVAIVVVVGGFSVLRNEPLLGTSVISVGTIIVFLQYVQRFNQPIQQIAVLWTNIQSAIAGGERIFELLDEPIEIEDKPNAPAIPPMTGKVEFRDVWAEYEKGQPILKGVNFTIEAGQMVAIVGPTGAGKTTIINLLPRFYDVTKGAVLIDGHDVRDVAMASIREQIGIVLQDTFLFSESVMENIRYGRLGATDEEVIAAAKMVEADSFIERLPQGYQTILGERGSGLSQGQRQLIAIARVALMNPHILILDEATSSVDTRTERLIQKAFENLLEGRTSFVIAHRLSTIRNADIVLMIKDGEIIERGTHRELLEHRGAYYELYMSQFRHEEVEEPAAISA